MMIGEPRAPCVFCKGWIQLIDRLPPCGLVLLHSAPQCSLFDRLDVGEFIAASVDALVGVDEGDRLRAEIVADFQKQKEQLA